MPIHDWNHSRWWIDLHWVTESKKRNIGLYANCNHVHVRHNGAPMSRKHWVVLNNWTINTSHWIWIIRFRLFWPGIYACDHTTPQFYYHRSVCPVSFHEVCDGYRRIRNMRGHPGLWVQITRVWKCIRVRILALYWGTDIPAGRTYIYIYIWIVKSKRGGNSGER